MIINETEKNGMSFQILGKSWNKHYGINYPGVSLFHLTDSYTINIQYFL